MMKRPPPKTLAVRIRSFDKTLLRLGLLAAALLPQSAHASLFHGETLDSIANGISWAVLVIAPVIGITVFWLVHILPEKIAHKRMHPQTRLIQCLCLMSLVFGGILWPLAWLLAYSKPVFHKLAYGTDIDESLAHDAHDDHGGHDHGEALKEEASEVEKLRARIAQLERQITGGQS
jgi:CBS domain containing-hemolysin-like protein